MTVFLGLCAGLGVGVGAMWVALWPRCWPKPGRGWPVPDKTTLIAGAVLGLCAAVLGDAGAALWGFAAIGAVLVGIDARCGVLPDAPVLICAALGAVLVWVGVLPHGPLAAVLGAGVGAAVFWGMAALFQARTGRQGLGGGDITLIAALGVWVGLAGVPMVIVTAAAAALSVAVMRGQGRLAFGPYLVLATAVVLLWELLDLPGPLGYAFAL